MKKIMSVFILTITLMLTTTAVFAKASDIIKVNRNIDVAKGMIVNDIVAVKGNVIVSGKVAGNIVVIRGSVILRSDAIVGGQVVVVGGEVVKDPAAIIGGRITQIYIPHFVPSAISILKSGWIALWATISLLVLFGFLGLAILLAALIPDHMGASVKALEKAFIPMLLWGVFWSLMIVPVAALLAISIVGIILIPLEILLIALALLIGYVAAAIFIGKNVLMSLGKKTIPFLDAVLGILILFLIGFVPLVGPIIKVLFLMAGFGAVVTTRFGTAR